MKQGKVKVSQLEKLSEIRALQLRTTEIEAAQAAVRRAAAQDDVLKAETSLSEAEKGWQTSLESAGLLTGIASLWAAAVVRQQTAVAAAEETLTDAEAEARLGKAQWQRAMVLEEMARELAASTRESIVQHHQEAALSEATDRFSYWGTRP